MEKDKTSAAAMQELYPWLKPVGGIGWWDLKPVKANLSAHLKHLFPGEKFAIHIDRRGGPMLRVSWEDGPTVKGVEEAAAPFLYAREWNRQCECTNYGPTPFTEEFGGVNGMELERTEGHMLSDGCLKEVERLMAEAPDWHGNPLEYACNELSAAGRFKALGPGGYGRARRAAEDKKELARLLARCTPLYAAEKRERLSRAMAEFEEECRQRKAAQEASGGSGRNP